MADHIEVLCITKTNRHYPPDRIRIFGGVDSDGKTWRLSIGEAVTAVEKGIFSFFVTCGKARVPLVVDLYEGRKYLRAETTEANEQLLSLPECGTTAGSGS